MQIHFDDCQRLFELPRAQLLRTLASFARGQPLWHPLGFVSCTVAQGPEWALKVHLWPVGARLTKKPNWPIHDHAFKIESRVLHGALRNRVYSLSPGEKFELYRVDYESKASSLIATGRRADLILEKSAMQETDSIYAIDKGVFHNSFVPCSKSTATVVLKTVRQSDMPLVVGRPFSVGVKLPLYSRTVFPESIFWDSVFVQPSLQSTIGLEIGVVRLENFQDSWAVEYAREVVKLKLILGDRFCGAEHIGSTSIFGLDAKPIIDLMIAVPSMDVAQAAIEDLTRAGYVFRPDGSLADRVYFNKRDSGRDSHHISLTTIDSNFWAEKIVFREYLRADEKLREEYQLLKRDLSSRHPRDRVAYTNSKRDFVYRVLDRAYANRFGDPLLLQKLRPIAVQ